MNILWQNEHYPDPVKGGGGAINTFYIVHALQQLGHRAVILSRGPKGCQPFREQVNGTTVQRIAPPDMPAKLWPLWPLLETRYVLPVLHDIISSFDLFIGIDYSFALAVKKLYPNRRLVYRVEGLRTAHDAAVGVKKTESTNSSLTLKRRCLRRLSLFENDLMEQRAWNACDAIIVKSAFMKKELETTHNISAAKINIIPNGVDYNRYANASPKPDILAQIGNFHNNKVVITFAGRLVKMKNVSYLLKAFTRMKEKEKSLLLILGDGDQRAELEHEVKVLGICACVQFVGHTDHVEDYLSVSDIFVLPSTYEPFGNALIEAMAAALPCLALRPDFDKFRLATVEIIDDGRTGYLVDGDDPADLAEKLDVLVANAGLRRRFGLAAQAKCRQIYNWETCARSYVELAEHLRNGAAPLKSHHE